MSFAFYLLGAYLIGSFPTAYVAAKRLKGIDIRTQGSGNVGATNAFRVLGKGPGALVFIIDFLKGWLPVFVYQIWFSGLSAGLLAPDAAALLVGFCAILGHVFTPFLSFKGGKGVATGAGVLCAAFPILFLLAMGVWGLTFMLTRIVSVSSLVALIGLLAGALVFKKSGTVLALLMVILLLIVWTHRSNLSRLKSGKEGKL